MNVEQKKQARDFAVQYLFSLILASDDEVKETLQGNEEALKQSLTETFPGCSNESILAKTASIVHACLADWQNLTKIIENDLDNWKIDRLLKTDLAVLIVGTQEIISKENPLPVVINEAVELSKTYGSKDSPKFINGILDKIAKKNGH